MVINKKNESEIEIYIVAHKKVDIPNLEGYKLIEVGAEFHENHFGDLQDNLGDNISNKNKTFCELTAYYWIWKNSTAKQVGLVHYRRFFSKKRFNDKVDLYLTVDEAKRILKEYDVILPEKIFWKNYTVATGYDHGAGFLKDLYEVRNIIEERCPEYLLEWDIITEGKEASYCNMFVMDKDRFDSYCEWVFGILFEAEKKIDITQYTDVEKRIFGFLAEILLNVWVKYNGLKVCYFPIIKRDQQMRKTLKILKFIEKIPGTRYLVRIGMTVDFNRQQH